MTINKQEILNCIQAFHRDFNSDFQTCLDYYPVNILFLIKHFYYEKKKGDLKIDSLNLNSVKDFNMLLVLFYESLLFFENKFKVIVISNKEGNFITIVNS